VGRGRLDEQLRALPISSRRLGWEIAWKPVLVLVVLIYAIVCIPLGVMWLEEQRTIAALPVVTVPDNPGSYRRVEGTVAFGPIYWAPRGTGRGGNNFAGAAVLVTLRSVGEALLLAESLSVADFRQMMAHVAHDTLRATGKVIDGITDTQRTYYGFDTGAFPQPPPGGRVMLLLSSP
jgi:hypothetical protein